MNEQIDKIYGAACILYGYLDEREFLEKFAELLLADVVQYLTDEIDRLSIYQNSLPEYSSHGKREDVDIAIEKCLDNIQGIKERFGVKK
jgi:hypothetical protein